MLKTITKISKIIDPECSGPMELVVVSLVHLALAMVLVVGLAEAFVGK